MCFPYDSLPIETGLSTVRAPKLLPETLNVLYSTAEQSRRVFPPLLASKYSRLPASPVTVRSHEVTHEENCMKVARQVSYIQVILDMYESNGSRNFGRFDSSRVRWPLKKVKKGQSTQNSKILESSNVHALF